MECFKKNFPLVCFYAYESGTAIEIHWYNWFDTMSYLSESIFSFASDLVTGQINAKQKTKAMYSALARNISETRYNINCTMTYHNL